MAHEGLPEIKCRYDTQGVPCLKTQMIDAYAAELLRQYNPRALEEPTPLKATHFLESFLDLRVNIVQIVSPNEDDPILGATSFSDGGILPIVDAETGRKRLMPLERGDVAIDESLYGDEAYRTESGIYVRANFTGFHEAGHWLLHQRYYAGDMMGAEGQSECDDASPKCCYRSVLDQDKPFTIEDDYGRMEYQANAFAGCITMPHGVFLPVMRQELRAHGVYKGIISRGMDADMDILADEILPARAAELFGVSKASARKRLVQVGLVAKRRYDAYADYRHAGLA